MLERRVRFGFLITASNVDLVRTAMELRALHVCP